MLKNPREAPFFMHPFLHIGNISLPMYGLCTMVGTVFALIAVFRLRKKGSPLSEDNLLDALIWAILLGFLCSKILYFIVEPPQMPHSWAELWDLITAGLVFYGGLLGGLLGLVFVSLKTKKHIKIVRRDGVGGMVFIAANPSDYRAGMNAAVEIIRLLEAV